MHIDIAQLTITFGSRVLLDKFDAQIAARTMTAVVGPSGSGKTSLLAAIAGQGSVSGGSIAFVDDSGVRVSSARWDKVCWIPQSLNALGSRSVLDNAMLAALGEGRSISESTDIAHECLRSVGLGDKVEMAAKNLSGGELQRLAIARVLASSRPVLLADEPTANLDEANAEVIGTLLRKAATTKTVIIATHDPALWSGANMVLKLRNKAVSK